MRYTTWEKTHFNTIGIDNMETHKVYIVETVRYMIDVEAETAEEALKLAPEVFCEIADHNACFGDVVSRTPEYIEPKSPDLD
jgi:hypothetical protein